MTTYPRVKMKTFELQLADVVDIGSMGSDGWNTAIVKQIEGDNVTLFRPYGTNADFSYTGGVLCYVGIEQYVVPRSSSMEFFVHRRTDLR
jgi:hypothetical protein